MFMFCVVGEDKKGKTQKNQDKEQVRGYNFV
jgi:hypothetical protein